MKLKILVFQEVEIDESKLEDYAKEVRDRFEMEKDSSVNMADILNQAGLDGDVDLPDKEWELDGYEDDLSPEEIADMREE